MRIRTFGGLWIEGLAESPAIGPRRLALLALVAAAGKRGISRDRVIGILWPDAEEEQARHTLSQTIYTLKRDTGRDWIIAGSELRLDPSISTDVGELQAALASGSLESVDSLATGVFLDGFYLAGAPEFERWVEEERARLRSAVARTLEQLSVRADESQDHHGAVRWWTRLSEVDPLNARYAAGKMRALAAAGDRASALAHARGYAELLRRELDADVDPAIRHLVASLRAESPLAPMAPVPESEPPAARPASPAVPPAPVQPGAWRRRVIPALLVPVMLLAAVLLLRPQPAGHAPFLAVGDIRVGDAGDTTRLGSVLRDMLATSLGGIEGLQVVANSRLVELLPRGEDGTRGVTNDAARRAGASEILEGELATESTGLVLSLRRVTLSNGAVQKGYVVRAADRYAVVDSAAAAIARDLNFTPPSITVARIRTSSPTAYALYDEGLRAQYAYDAPAAYRLMTASLNHDSTFAMAAYYVWQLSRLLVLHDTIQAAALARVQRLALRTTERERLLIQSSLGEMNAPLRTSAALAETLAVKYPADPDGQYILGSLRSSEGNRPAAVALFERVVELDSAASALKGPYCRACFALYAMRSEYLSWDSAGAAERVGRRLLALRPDEPAHWRGLIEPLLRQGKRVEAETAFARGEVDAATASFHLHRDQLRWGRYEEANRQLVEEAASLDRGIRSDARWLLLLALRDQGRLREAKALVDRGRLPDTDRHVLQPRPAPEDGALLATEMRQPARTIRTHRRNAEAHARSSMPPAQRAGHIVWNLTLAGTAYAAAGDTVIVRRLADSVEAIGRDSNWGRNIRLHHMLRGLLFQLEGRHAEAVDAFQRSLISLTDGYTRTNLMMARSLLELGRGSEAITLLRAAIHGGVDGSNTYVSRTELHEALAQAFEQAEQRDSAMVHWRAVESGWRRADPEFRERYLRAKAKAGS